ncbi:MAG: hypothetical protein K9I84_16395 [Leadbetterella sp.]|nr:hypothetical protein [Leadbetterella sp.]
MNAAQSQTANDVCSCRACNMEQPVTIIPDLPVNKWTCRNCNLIQVWQPSPSFNQVHEVVSKTRSLTQGTLFNSGPLVGIGADGCLSGVYPNPSHTTNIFLAAAGIAIIAILIEYYRVKYPTVVANGNRRDVLHASPQRQKASNKVSGVDNWNRQLSILRVSVMSNAQSVAKDKKRGRLLISSLFQSFQSIPKTSKLSQS